MRFYVTTRRLLTALFVLQGTAVDVVSGATKMEELQRLDYRLYPQRTKEEAAVLEWGHSAIISALDASVALFGPQTSQAALFEVEAKPVLAVPITGVTRKGENDDPVVLAKLNNADEVHGNMVVMTNAGGLLTGVEMAKIAQLSGAAALLVINMDELRPEDIYRLPVTEGAEDVQIPVVMISLNSANALASATITPQTKRIRNNGMPERVRLYSGGDRPFFEDVEAAEPTVYLIHNLLTESECDSIIRQAQGRLSPVTKPDTLQLTLDAAYFHNVERVMLWQGMLKGPERKQIDERIEQVTGFPADHFTDFVVDRLDHGAYWSPHYDAMIGDSSYAPLATITIFLSEVIEGGEVVYPSTKTTAIKVKPIKGLAVVHHNNNERERFDLKSLHALLPGSGPLWVARKFIMPKPLSKARRIVLPFLALPFRGRLPSPVVSMYELFVKIFDHEEGSRYFDMGITFLPVLLILYGGQWLAEYVQKQLKGGPSERGSKKGPKETPSKGRSKTDKKNK